MEDEPLNTAVITQCTALHGNTSTFMSLGNKVRLIIHARAGTGSFRSGFEHYCEALSS
jgi:hypothetical protein